MKKRNNKYSKKWIISVAVCFSVVYISILSRNEFDAQRMREENVSKVVDYIEDLRDTGYTPTEIKDLVEVSYEGYVIIASPRAIKVSIRMPNDSSKLLANIPMF